MSRSTRNDEGPLFLPGVERGLQPVRGMAGIVHPIALAPLAHRVARDVELARQLVVAAGGLLDRRPYSRRGQVVVPDAYETMAGNGQLVARPGQLRGVTDALREDSGVDGLIPSRRPDFHVPGIHLHHSVNGDALARTGIDGPDSAIRIVDASARSHIGGEHHSFKMMVSAFERAATADLT
jgi:hypothetical protein